MTESGTSPAATPDGVAQFVLIEVDLHRGELHAVFRTFWEGQQRSDFGVKKGKSISMKEYVKLTVMEINQVKDEGVLILADPPRSSVVVKILMDGAPVPGYPPFMTVKVGQILTIQSMKRKLEALGVRNVIRH
jgi:hypothetical protein